MRNIIIGVGGHDASNNPQDIIKTFALGSCVAMIIIDPLKHIAGMAHIALPDSKIDPQKSINLPGYFVDTAIPALFQMMKDMGSTKIDRSMIIKLIGGAQIMDSNNTFDIGKRNVLAIKKLLWQKGMGPLAEDVGGDFSRTVSLYVKDGKTLITSHKRENLIL